MDDSAINSSLLSSTAHLENVEQLIRNLEKQTLDLDNFEDILNNRNRQEIITKSFSSVLSNNMAIDDEPEDNFLVKSISFANHGASTIADANLSMDSLFNQRDLFDNDDLKNQQTPPGNDQSLYVDQEARFTWDDRYDTRANYRLTYSTDKQQQIESNTDKARRHKTHHHHRHKQRTPDPQSNSMYSDDGLPPPNVTSHMNDWSMRSSVNPLEQSTDQGDHKAMGISQSQQQQQQANFIRSQSHPTSFSPPQQLPANNTSPNSSTTSSSSSASWRRMKDSQRTTSGIETKETRPPSPLSLYKIFQQKSHMPASSSSRSAFQFYRQQSDSIVPNTIDSMTISGEKLQTDKSRINQYAKKPYETDRRSSQTPTSSTDQAIQTSIYIDSSSNSPMNSRFQMTSGTAVKSESYDHLSSHTASNTSHHLTVPPRSASSSTVHKSLPDLAFISQYSKEIPRSRATSPLQSTSNASMTASPSPLIVQPKQDAERPRTLKSIKRYKNSKHSTEPLGVFYSPQLRKTFAAVPASEVITAPNETRTIIKMKRPPSYQNGRHQTSNLKSCLKYGPRANSCDIQAMLKDRRSPVISLAVHEPTSNQDSISPTSKRRCSETDAPPKRPDNIGPVNAHATGSSNDLNAYLAQNFSREHYSDHDIALMLQQQQNQTKKSVSFSENIAKHLISPCNPAITFDMQPELADDSPTTTHDVNLTLALHGAKESLTRKPTAHYGGMRRCQTDVIVMDRVHHLHSFTESPPNEFRFQEVDSVAPDSDDEDDQTILEKTHVNIVPDRVEPAPSLATPPITTKTPNSKTTVENTSPFNDKENEIPEPSVTMNVSTATLVPTNDPPLDGLLAKVAATVKSIFDVKRAEKTFFLANEHNARLDALLKNELCTNLQHILEHGLKPQRKETSLNKQITLWKIIETSINQGASLQVFHDAKEIAQNASPYWIYKFQAFIFALLNKNELINWLYRFVKQEEVLLRYYQSPDALILRKTQSAFNLFERIMTQLEKLSPLAFRLTYQSPPLPSHIEEQLTTSTISMHSNKTSARDWVMTISKRPSKTLTQQITPPMSMVAATTAGPQPADTLRSTLTRKINSLFTKTNPVQPPQRKTPSAVTGKLPTAKPPTIRVVSPVVSRRPRLSNVFVNATAAATSNKPVIVASPKLNHINRSGSMRRAISPSVVVAPSPPPTLNTAGPTCPTIPTFQSKIPRPSLNVDKPKSVRYCSTALPPK